MIFSENRCSLNNILMLIYPPSYAWGYDFCFHTIPRCLMSPTKHALYMHTHCWPGRLKSKSNSKPHRLLMRNFHISIIVLVFQGCGRVIYFKAPVCVHSYTYYKIPYMTRATHASHLCKNNRHLDQVFFSFPIWCC